MKRVIVCLLIIALLISSGCDAQPQQPKNGDAGTEDFSLLGMSRKMDWTFGMGEVFSNEAPLQQSSLIPQQRIEQSKDEKAQTRTSTEKTLKETQRVERQIIRNGRLTLELESPAQGQQRISAIVESHQGFVIVSEFSQFTKDETNQSVTITVRVPASQFSETLAEIHAVGSRVIFENITGQDVTEEFLDLEAHLKTQRALEEQLLQLMRKTATVSNALEVQRELTGVRTEIEKLVGRKQFLADQAAFSTIAILLQTPTAIVSASTSGTGDKFKKAFADGIRIAVGIILLLIRLLFAAIPILFFVVLPFRYLRKRLTGRRLVNPTTPTPQPQ